MENKFVNGLFINKPHENAPDFVKCKLSFSVAKFIEFLKENANDKGYVKIDILSGKEGTLYAKLDDWKPKEKIEEEFVNVDDEIKISEIPF